MRYAIIFFLFAFAGNAQRYDIISGKFENLKDIAVYNITFDYKDMAIHGYDSEEAFVAEKVAKRKNRPEKAERFQQEWYGNRKEIYEPRFIAFFNSRFTNGEVKVVLDQSAQYTMDIKTVWMYPGYGIGVGGEPTKVTALVTVFETNNPENKILQVKFAKAIGLENKDLDNFGERISGAYEKLAKNLVQQIKRVL